MKLEIRNYYLDLNLVNGLSPDVAERIFDLYYQLCRGDSGLPGCVESYFNTLLKSGYLKISDKEEKLEPING